MDAKQIVVLALKASIIATVFSYGLRAGLGALSSLTRHPGLWVRSLLAMLVIMPLVAIVLERLSDVRHLTEIALIALAISPVPPMLPKRQANAGAEADYGLSLMALLSVVAIVAIPVWTAILATLFQRPLEASPGKVTGIIMVMMLLPLAAGMTLKTIAPAIASRLRPIAAAIGGVLLPLGALVLLTAIWRGVLDAAGGGAVLAIIAFIVIGLIVGHLLGGPDPEHRMVLALSTACRHPAIAFSIAAANFPDDHFGGTIVLYLILNTIIGLPYLRWQRSRVHA